MGTDETQPDTIQGASAPDPSPAAPAPAGEPAPTPAAAPAVPEVPAGSEPQVTPVVDPEHTDAPAVPVGTPPAPVADPTPPAESAGPTEPAPARPVLVNNFTRRSGDDALLGSWVDVVAGEFQGRFGAYADDVSHDPKSGYPDQVLIRTRDAANELIVVAYADIRPSERTGGR